MAINKQLKTQNEHIQDSLSAVKTAVEKLVSEGFTVTGFTVGLSKPCIHILPRSQCQDLTQAWTKIKTGPTGRQVERVAMVADCQVRWIDRDYDRNYH